MDGYTVEEAASVLGVPRERVWELLARGIITGSADLGGAMRVRLKAEPAAVPAPAPVERPPEAAYGPSTELTPFRELLTEFRSLTERYGQALLALGEARGEVAGLRSRVDMLEARVDLRLPSSAAPISSAWSSTPWPTPTERVVQPPPAPPPTVEAAPVYEGATTAEHEEATAPAHDEEAAPHRRRGRAARRATERFADALARAEDPSLPELPGAEETAAAIAALRQEHPPASVPEPDTSDRDAEGSLPRELPSAEHVLVADEDDAARDVAATVTVEVAPPGEAQPADAEPDLEPAQAVATPVEPIAGAPAEAKLEPDPAAALPEPTPVSSVDGSEGAQGGAEPGVEWDTERYSAAIEEPGWISADEPEPPAAWSPPAEPKAPEPPAEPQAPAAPAEQEAAAAPAEQEPPAAWSPPAEPEAPEDAVPAESAAPEPAAIEADEPAEDVPAWRRSRAQERSEASTAIPIESSGSRELDEGLAALDALVNPQPSPDDAGDAWASGMDREAQPIGAPRPQAWVRPSPPPQLVTRSSASRAYRRLRRIFPT